jgi:hypothetical protein
MKLRRTDLFSIGRCRKILQKEKHWDAMKFSQTSAELVDSNWICLGFADAKRYHCETNHSKAMKDYQYQ